MNTNELRRNPQSAMLRGCLIVLCAWIVYLGCAWLPQPLLIDEVVFAQLAHKPFSEFGHPPGYLHALGLFASCFRLPDVWLRLIGVLALLLTAAAAYALAERLEPSAGIWALVLLLTNPLALRGAFVLDIDNTLMMLWVAASVCALSFVSWPLSRRLVILGGFWWAAGLWIKLTTPLLWPFVLLAVYGFRGQWRQGFKDVTQMVGMGLAIFLVAWTLYSRAAHIAWNAVFSGRILAMLLRGASDPGSILAAELAERALRIGLWLGPLTVVLWLVSTGYWLRCWVRLPFPEAWVAALVYGWGMLAGYWVIGGLIWSFARYHSPEVPLVSALAAVAIGQRLKGVCLSVGSVALPLLIAALWSFLGLGDSLHLVNYTLRHAMLFAPQAVKPLAKTILVQQASLLPLVLALAFLFWRRHSAALSGAAACLLALALAAIGSGIGLSLRQRAADYSTSYCYGRPWKTYYAIQEGVLDFHARHPQAKIMAPFDTFQAQLTEEEFRRIFVNEWFAVQAEKTFTDALDDPQLGLCVRDTEFSSAQALKARWSSIEAQKILEKKFKPIKLGTAQGWIRRQEETAP